MENYLIYVERERFRHGVNMGPPEILSPWAENSKRGWQLLDSAAKILHANLAS